ncbi:MAG: hypothetical protein ABUL62_21785 [Myxococcales bacterium]
MSSNARRVAGWLGACVILGLAGAGVAEAQVTQTDAAKTPLPQPVGTAELNLVNDSWAWNSNTDINQDATGANLNPAVKYGAYYAPPMYPQFVTGDAITLQGLFKWRKEMIDPVKDASTGPGYFSAKCGFSGQLLLMGGNCQVKFGWYNVIDPTSKTPPAASEIYPFIDEPLTSLNCTQEDGVAPKTDGFCPLAWDNRGPRQLSKLRWVPKTFSSGDISKDPRYKGGFVAFAVIGASSGKCTQSKFSMYEHNQRNAQGEPWVTTLIYHSTVDPGGFYMAFEDLPMPANDWKQAGTGADGDFNDFVFYVSGLTCDGGNMPCDTGLQGACSVGRTDCSANGEPPVCRPVVQKGAEICDNVDNDCDGVIDNGDGLCTNPDKPFCFQGQCVGTCVGGEFPCPVGLECDVSGHCSDPVCASVTCAPGTACRNGQCVDPCTGVTCPYGQSCQLGQCVDPCNGVTCPGDRVCERGLCVANCSCRGCDTGLMCTSDGKCTDPACADVMCAAGTICKAGACVDACAGVTCPGNGVCSLGTCSTPMPGDGNGGSGPGSIGFGGNTGIDFGGGTSVGNGTSTGANTGSSNHGVASKSSGCGCRVADRPANLPAQLAWIGSAVALAFAARKRRQARKSAAN